METTKKIVGILLCSLLVLTLTACGGGTSPTPSAQPSATPTVVLPSQTPLPTPEPEFEGVDVNVGMVKGPTGVGAVYLMEGSKNGETVNNYNFTLAAAPTEFTAMLANGELDIAAVPTNMASILYNRLEGGVKILAINTLGVLQILEKGETIQSVEDLRGKTIYAMGQAANPEYVLNYILRGNGLTPGTDVTIEFREADEITALMATGEATVAMLAVPAATAVKVRVPEVRTALNLTEEWGKLVEEGELTQGCVVVRTAFLEENPRAVKCFMDEYAASIARVNERVAGVYDLLVVHEIIAAAAIAEAALPECAVTYIDGEELSVYLDPYFQILFDAEPGSIGGAMPDEGIYYTGYTAVETAN